MRSRYCAFALKIPQYIIKTTHKENQDFSLDITNWKDDISDFCTTCDFQKLEILNFIDGDIESYVAFKATIICEDNDSSFTEKSKFLKVNNMWLYHSGEFL